VGNQRLEALRVHYRNRANGVTAQLVQAERGIHARQDVTADQKRGMLNSVRDQAHQRLRDLHRELQGAQQNTIAKLREGIYRLPPSTANTLDWRDAWARAKAIADVHDDHDPQRALRQAQQAFSVAAMVGDEPMLRALNLAAELRGWTAIHRAFRAQVPEAGAIMDELDEIGAELDDREVQFAEAAAFELPRPIPPPPGPSLAVALDDQAQQWNASSTPTR
jgi:hypothetical protein